MKADPQLSDRGHGRRTGVSHHTAAGVRDELEGRGQIAHVEQRTDSLGRQQPAEKLKPPAPQPRNDTDPPGTGWLADTLGGDLELSERKRDELIRLMAGEGMSLRAIGKAVGVSEPTVRRQLRQDDAPELPDKVIGQDGKEYRRPRARARDELEANAALQH